MRCLTASGPALSRLPCCRARRRSALQSPGSSRLLEWLASRPRTGCGACPPWGAALHRRVRRPRSVGATPTRPVRRAARQKRVSRRASQRQRARRQRPWRSSRSVVWLVLITCLSEGVVVEGVVVRESSARDRPPAGQDSFDPDSCHDPTTMSAIHPKATNTASPSADERMTAPNSRSAWSIAL